jgi:nucleotide-binding universal stress UspA family protein
MKVLVAIDSSQYSSQVLSAVFKRLWSADCEFRIVTLIEPCPDWDSEEQFIHQSELILTERVAELRKRLPHHAIVAEAIVGSAATDINMIASEWEADLIVLGSHGDTGIRKTHIGSVAAAVVNQAPCSVELVKIRRIPANEQSQKKTAAALKN